MIPKISSRTTARVGSLHADAIYLDWWADFRADLGKLNEIILGNTVAELICEQVPLAGEVARGMAVILFLSRCCRCGERPWLNVFNARRCGGLVGQVLGRGYRCSSALSRGTWKIYRAAAAYDGNASCNCQGVKAANGVTSAGV
jgi:hypothetical protein